MVAHPYHGAFSDELNFNGLADYSDVYAGELKKVEDKKKEIANIESRIYGNVLALFAIFAAIFTLVNVNAGGLSSNITTVNFVATRPADYWRFSNSCIRNRDLPC